MEAQYNILMHSLLCRFTHFRVDQLLKNFIQYSYCTKLSEKYFAKSLVTKLNIGKTLEKCIT